eukprot:3901848-Alexandrium_andersonii.AAC.1
MRERVARRLTAPSLRLALLQCFVRVQARGAWQPFRPTHSSGRGALGREMSELHLADVLAQAP